MNICIIGYGLTSLSLAKNLINKKINVHLYHRNKIANLSSSRTIGISKNNLEFFKKDILNISKKFFWEIKKIEIFSEKLKNENLLRFENDQDKLFYMIKNNKLYESLKNKVSKNKFFKKSLIKKNSFYRDLLEKNKFDLIINCDSNNFITKKFFMKKINKNYDNRAFTTILRHEKIDNNTATQIFTKNGPIAFLPISGSETSIVCSLDTKNKKYKNSEVIDLITKNNPKYKINNIAKLNNFRLSASNLRNYHHKNILAFGDMLHRIHPLAGQGFNMIIRDLRILSQIIEDKIELGIQLDSSVLSEFEKKTKDKNFVFSNAIGLIYEIFNFDKKVKNKNFNNILKSVGKNKNFNNHFIKLADLGLNS
jgi:2-octaprenyl-6-methoxyphenol hydroxylase